MTLSATEARYKHAIVTTVETRWGAHSHSAVRKLSVIVDDCREAARFLEITNLYAVEEAIEHLAEKNWLMPKAHMALAERCDTDPVRQAP